LRITIFRRLRKDRRGVSNIIVVALSLVIMLAIVSDIVLWNYEMTQVDWEKMKEDLTITNARSGATPSWITTETEYIVNTGTKTSGSYADTKAIDGSYESFTEEAVSLANVTLVNGESFEGDWLPAGWSETDAWDKESDYSHDGVYSADFDGVQGGGGGSGYLYSPVMDCSDAHAIYLEFWWQDRSLDYDDFILEYYNGSSWNSIQDLDQLASLNGWHYYAEAVTDNQYFVSDFQVRWWAKSMWSGETACVDEVTIKKMSSSATNLFDITGSFSVDLSGYQTEQIQTLELQLMFRASDSAENWYLQAFNWTSSGYSDNGFNVTSGHTPTTGWDYYKVNFADVWQDYVDGDGTIKVRLIDEGGDDDQTTVNIDFLGINVKTDASLFTFQNEGSLTVRLVSLWVTNSTYHQHYDIDVFLNSGATKNYVSYDIELPAGNYIVKAVTERGNTAVFSGN
jgi:hypothetical protein